MSGGTGTTMVPSFAESGVGYTRSFDSVNTAQNTVTATKRNSQSQNGYIQIRVY